MILLRTDAEGAPEIANALAEKRENAIERLEKLQPKRGATS